MRQFDLYLKTAEEAAQRGAVLFKKHFGRAEGVEYKNGDPRNLVTEADRNIEKLITEYISSRFPDHVIVGEEFSSDKKTSDDKFVWYIDPIDGTRNYILGLPFCSTSIGLWKGNEPIIGVVYDPVLEIMYTSLKGGGAFKNRDNKREKIAVSKVGKRESAIMSVGWKENADATLIFERVVSKVNKARVFASCALELCFVAEGKLDLYVAKDRNIWDIAAGIAILSEAGGKTTDWQGIAPTPSTPHIIGSNGQLHSSILELLK